MALTLIVWPVGAMIRRHYGQTLELAGDARRIRLVVYAACILCFVVIAMLASFLNKFSNDFGLGKNGDFNIHLMQLFGILTGFGAIAAIYQSIGAWRDSGRWIWAKIWNTLLALAVLFFFWFLFHWHLLNWNLNY
jgi:hypothetical protein